MSLYKNKYRVESNRLENWDYAGKGIYFITICCRNREYHLGEVIDGEMVINEKGKIVYNEIINSVKIRTKWVFHNWIIKPNHLHLLIEIKESQPKYNFSTLRIIEDSIDVETRNLFLNFSSDKIIEKTERGIIFQNINNSEETHCGAFQNDASQNGASQNGTSQTQLKSSKSQQENSDTFPREAINKFYRKPKSISSFVAQFKSVISKQINELESSKESIWQSNYHDSIIKSPEMFKKVYFYIQNNPKNWEADSLKKQQ